MPRFHFLHHDYGADLDPEALAVLQATARRVRGPLVGDLDSLDDWLARVAAVG